MNSLTDYTTVSGLILQFCPNEQPHAHLTCLRCCYYPALKATGGSKHWLSPIEAFTFSYKRLMSHIFLFIPNLYLRVSLAKFNLEFWPDVQSQWSCFWVPHEVTSLCIAQHNVSQKPDGMCSLLGVVAEKLVENPWRTAGVLWPHGICEPYGGLNPGNVLERASPLCSELPLLSAAVLHLHNYFTEFLFSALSGSRQQCLEERVSTSICHFLLPAKPNLHPYLYRNELG